MKARKYFYSAILAAGMLGMSGCVGDLDVVPLDSTVNTADRAYQTAEDYAKGLAKLYALWAMSGQGGASSSDIGIGDAGNTTLVRSWWICQEQPTDEMKNATSDGWASAFNYMTWGTSRIEPTEAVYQRCMYVVALVNDFLKQLPNAPAGIDKVNYEAQARFCRALAYYTLMDVYGRPPFITESTYSLQPPQIERADLFDWIESELKWVIESGNLPEKQTGADRGRADQGSAWALLARMYLNAEVYTGTEHYSECIQACKQVFTMGYELADEYHALFCGDNTENPDAANEIIFPVLLDGDATQTWANLISSTRPAYATEDIENDTSSDQAKKKYAFCFENWGTREGWGNYRSAGQLIDFFEFSGNVKSTGTLLDKRGLFRDTTYQEVPLNQYIENEPANTFYTDGWWVYKFSNLTHDGKTLDIYQAAESAVFVSTDFPLIRLGDVYLIFAEAVARKNDTENIAEAVDKVNQLRRRGEVSDIDDKWLVATAPVGGSAKSVPYGNILNERTRELYWEGQRRTDLIRFGLFTSGDYVWDWKGGIQGGTGVNSRYNLYPIPLTDLTSNSNLHQNEGY
ncbi:MAG TPA: RagB/SusD family nutrient uptake outer membrane protein [Bacteroidaceae bacterium]|nr:RagB/SusD family nutrient uptake outer membrane protein [Bacteroidaceae bacterium]